MISTEQLYQTLQQRFGFSRFRPGQLEALTALTAKRNTLAVLPTGAGKTLIYELYGAYPATRADRLTADLIDARSSRR